MPVTLTAKSFPVDQEGVAIIETTHFDMTSSKRVLGDDDQYVTFEFQAPGGGAIAAGYFFEVGAPSTPIFSMTKDRMTPGASDLRFQSTGATSPAIEVNVRLLDSSGITRNSGYEAVTVIFDPSPIWPDATMDLNQNQTKVLGVADIEFKDLDASGAVTSAGDVEFKVVSAANVRLEHQSSPGVWTEIREYSVASETSTLAEFKSGNLRVVSTGAGTPALTLSARNSATGSTWVDQPITINYNLLPVVSTSTWNIPENGVVDLTAVMLGVNEAGTWTPGVVAVTKVQYELKSAPGTPIASFTKAQVDGGLLQIRHVCPGVPAPSLTFADSQGAAPAGGAVMPTASLVAAPTLDTASTALSFDQGVPKVLLGTELSASDVSGTPSTGISLDLTVTNAQFQVRPDTGSAWGTASSTVTVTQALVSGGLVRVVPDNSVTKPEMTVTEIRSTTGAKTSTSQGQLTTMNLAPTTAGTKQVAVDQDGQVVLSTDVMTVSDDKPGAVTIDLVASGGHFEVGGVTGSTPTEATGVTLAQWNAGDVVFLGDDGATTYTLSYTIKDGPITLATEQFTTTVKLKPVLTVSDLGAVADGTEFKLTSTHLSATHALAAGDGSDLTFMPSNLAHGTLRIGGVLMNPAAPVSFTLKQLNDGLVQGVSSGDGQALTFDVAACFDGLCSDSASLAPASFVVAPSVDTSTRTPIEATQGTLVPLTEAHLGTITPPAGTALADVEVELSGFVGGSAEWADDGTPATVVTIQQIRDGEVLLDVTGDPFGFDYAVRLPGGAASASPVTVSSAAEGIELNHPPVVSGVISPMVAEQGTSLDQVIVFDAASGVTDVDGDDLGITAVRPVSGPTDGVVVTAFNGSAPGATDVTAPYIAFSATAGAVGTALWDVVISDAKGGEVVSRTGLDVQPGETAGGPSPFYDGLGFKIMMPLVSYFVTNSVLRKINLNQRRGYPLANALRKEHNLVYNNFSNGEGEVFKAAIESLGHELIRGQGNEHFLEEVTVDCYGSLAVCIAEILDRSKLFRPAGPLSGLWSLFWLFNSKKGWPEQIDLPAFKALLKPLARNIREAWRAEKDPATRWPTPRGDGHASRLFGCISMSWCGGCLDGIRSSLAHRSADTVTSRAASRMEMLELQRTESLEGGVRPDSPSFVPQGGGASPLPSSQLSPELTVPDEQPGASGYETGPSFGNPTIAVAAAASAGYSEAYSSTTSAGTQGEYTLPSAASSGGAPAGEYDYGAYGQGY